MPSSFRKRVPLVILLSLALAPSPGAWAQPTQRDVLRNGTARLVKLQADRTADNAGNGYSDGDPDDAGWDASVSTADTGHSSQSSPPNTYGVTAVGMALAYQRNAASFNAFIACLDAYSEMANDPAIVSGADPTFLFLMRRLTADNTFANEARAKWNLAIDALGGGDVTAAAQAIKQRRVTEGHPDLYPWDIAWFVISANRLEKLFPGQGFTLDSTIFAQAVLNDLLAQTPVFDVNDATKDFYDIGLVGAALALRVVGLAPTQYNSLLDRIVARQNADGSWGFDDPHRAGNVQTTAYAAIVCKLFRNRGDAIGAKNAAANWLAASQMTNGGFHAYCGFDEVPEADGEALFAINLVPPTAAVILPCPQAPPATTCLHGPAATQSYYYDGINGLLNPSDGENWVATLTGIDGSSIAGNKIYRLMVQDQGQGSGFQSLSIEVHHDAAGAGGHLLQSKDIDFTVRSSHTFAAGDVNGAFDVRLEFQQRGDRKWDVTPQYRLPGGAWTIFADGSWTTATAFDLTSTRLAVQIDGGAAGTLCVVPPTGEPRPPTSLVVAPIVIQIAVPAAPVFTGSSPTSPANANNPSIQGTAEPGTTVRLYTTSDCSGASVASGTASAGGTFSIPVTVPDNSTTTFYATTTDGVGNTSLCSASGITYVEDSAAPPAPVVTGTSPVSPSNDTTPIVTGTAEVGATVDVFPNASCTGGPIGSGVANLFGSFNVTVTVASGSTTTFHARATDGAGNVSPCSATSTTYVEDSTAPAAPTLTGTSPVSPANQNTLNVLGSAEANSTVTLYSDPACSGATLGTTNAGAGSFSISITVADNTTTTIYATATDVAGNVSSCTATPLTYVEDSAPPAPPSLTSTAPGSPANNNTPSVAGTAEAGSTVRLYTSAACSGAPVGTGTATGGSFSIGVTVADDTSTTFYATATDVAGNVSTCSPTGITYVEDSSAPGAPSLTSTAPASPANNNSPSIAGTAEAGSTVQLYTSAACSGAAVASGVATGGSFSIPVSVGEDTTTTFWATATDVAGNTSPCSASGITYTEDSTAPNFSGATNATAASNTQISVDWVAATDTVSPSFLLVYDVCVSTTSGACGSSFSVQQTSAPGATSLTIGGLNPSTPYFFVVRSRDVAGNQDGNTFEVTATTLP
ncbi:MAG: hypothetical protein HY292_19655 [Planctomycetes bacterium]|nr:hypothetical protein [Planctomycetota bacterium]